MFHTTHLRIWALAAQGLTYLGGVMLGVTLLGPAGDAGPAGIPEGIPVGFPAVGDVGAGPPDGPPLWTSLPIYFLAIAVTLWGSRRERSHTTAKAGGGEAAAAGHALAVPRVNGIDATALAAGLVLLNAACAAAQVLIAA